MIDVASLLNWLRDTPELPWQNDSDPYHIWLTEIMLQQTTVATVSNRFKQWLTLFPTLKHVAEASEQEILRAWEGLGYYNRARNLRLCAQRVNRDGWPSTYKEMLQLPGVGNYTAAALMSAFYNAHHLAIDANLKRIFMRQRAQTSFTSIDQQWWETKMSLAMESYGSHNINFALIRLGQLICPVKNSKCTRCPLALSCLAHQQGVSHLIAKPIRHKITKLQSIVIVLVCKGKIWAMKRTQGIGKNLFSFPRYEEDALESLKKLYGPPVALEPVSHHYTHFTEHLLPYLFMVKDEATSPLDGQWYDRVTINTLPFLSSYRLILSKISW